MDFDDGDIIRLPDATAERMSGMIKEQSQDKHLESVDFLICFIMSHGSKGGIILGKDGNSLTFKYIEERFNRNNCPELYGKPKIFIIQACRGLDIEAGEQCSVPDSGPEKKTLPLKTDFLVAYPCEEDYRSFRHVKSGSYFIKAICSVFRQHWERKSLVSMLTLVNSLIADEEIKFERDGLIVACKQTANFNSSLRKKFYFYRKGNLYFNYPPSK